MLQGASRAPSWRFQAAAARAGCRDRGEALCHLEWGFESEQVKTFVQEGKLSLSLLLEVERNEEG